MTKGCGVRARGGRGAWIAPCAGALLVACQSYAPRPLERDAHRAAWHGRSLDGESLRAFLEGLEVDPTLSSKDFDPSDGLNLQEGRLLAHVFHPDLRLARLRVARSVAGAAHATRWPDPELEFDLLRISESVPDRWVVTPGVAFALPFSDRFGPGRDLAEAERHVAAAALAEEEWRVWHAVARAWIEWSALRLRIEETERFLERLGEPAQRAEQLVERGELPRSEAFLVVVELAQGASDLRGLRGEEAAALHRLRALLGLAPEATVELLPSLALPLVSGPGSPEAIEVRNPTLGRLRAAYEAAEQALRLEVAEQLPDVMLGPRYESDAGQTRWGLLGAIPLPVWNANRRAIAEATVERELARARVESEYERLVGRWAAALARARGHTDQREDLEQVLVPLVDRHLAEVDDLMRLGEGTTAVLVEGLTRAHQLKLDLIDTYAAEALARADLAHLIGPAPVGVEERKP